MILKQGHKYEPMPHDGKVIRRIYRGGRCYYIASPYSPEATQALKAAFPQYWTAIRDYGVAHPQLVPFINEDPMLIVSLVEVGKTRWLVGDGKAYIDTGIKPKADSVCRIQFKLNSKNNAYPWMFGAENSGRTNRYGVWGDGSTLALRFGSLSVSISKSFLKISVIIERKENGNVYVDGEDFGNAVCEDIDFSVFIFAVNYVGSGTTDGSPMDGSVVVYEIDGHRFIPHLHGGVAGMLDIVSLTFHPNANTQGAFTIEITDKE